MTAVSRSIPHGATCDTPGVPVAHVLTCQTWIERVGQQGVQESWRGDVAAAPASASSTSSTLSRKHLIQHPICVSRQQACPARHCQTWSTLQQIQPQIHVRQPPAWTIHHPEEAHAAARVRPRPNIHQRIQERSEEDDRAERVVRRQDYGTHYEQRPSVIRRAPTKVIQLEIRTIAIEQEEIEEELESTSAEEEGGEDSMDVELADDERPEEGEAVGGGDLEDAGEGDGSGRS